MMQKSGVEADVLGVRGWRIAVTSLVWHGLLPRVVAVVAAYLFFKVHNHNPQTQPVV